MSRAHIDEFVRLLSARSSGLSVEDYERSMEEALGRLAELEPPAKLLDEADYRRAHRIKGFLCSLSCYTFNYRHPQNDKVWELEGRWGAVMARYNRRLQIRAQEPRTIARYLLWNRRYPRIPAAHLYMLLRNHGFLRRTERGDCCVIGLSMKVGDNVFTVDHRGRHHRQYRQTVGRQAFPLNWIEDDLGKETAAAFIATLPLLDDTYTVTYITDGKWAARRVALRRSEKNRILEMEPVLRQVA